LAPVRVRTKWGLISPKDSVVIPVSGLTVSESFLAGRLRRQTPAAVGYTDSVRYRSSFRIYRRPFTPIPGYNYYPAYGFGEPLRRVVQSGEWDTSIFGQMTNSTLYWRSRSRGCETHRGLSKRKMGIH